MVFQVSLKKVDFSFPTQQKQRLEMFQFKIFFYVYRKHVYTKREKKVKGQQHN